MTQSECKSEGRPARRRKSLRQLDGAVFVAAIIGVALNVVAAFEQPVAVAQTERPYQPLVAFVAVDFHKRAEVTYVSQWILH